MRFPIELTPPAPGNNISFMYDLQQQEFIYVDVAFKNLLNIQETESPAEVMQRIPPQDLRYLETCFFELMEGRFAGAAEFRMKIPKGELHIRLTPFVLNLSSTKVIAGNAIDATEEVNNRDIIHKYANKKNSILNMLSHDLRGPLHVARNLVHALGENNAAASLAPLAGNVMKILDRSIDLITDLTTREFFETVEVQLVKKRINIAEKTAQYMEECRRSEELAQRLLYFSCPQREVYLDLDEAKFMQVYNNLISNALKFTREGGHIHLKIEDKGQFVLFSCSDDSIGIPKEDQERLFDKFTEARRTGLNGEPTLGLGLFIVKMIIEWHGGKIWVVSEEQKGSTFYFELPKPEIN